MSHPTDPIFVLDSGLGGLTVVRALLDRLPYERIVYFGDTARLPYGSKTRPTITHFVKQIIGWSERHHPKHVVVACNTASALALPEVRAAFPHIHISGVIEPGARAAAGASGKNEPLIGIIATEATIRSRAYEIAIRKRRQRARLLMTATPLLVPMIEEGRRNDDPLVELALRQYLRQMTRDRIDALVLGCTHYPLLKPAIRRIVGEDVAVIDSAQQCAEDVAARLVEAGTAATMGLMMGPASEDRSRLSAFVTDDPDRLARLGADFLGFGVEAPTLVPPEVLYQQDAGSLGLPAMTVPEISA
jgi:glutamate racemase